MSHLHRIMPPTKYVDDPPPKGRVVEVWEECTPRLAIWDGHEWRCIGSERRLDVVQGWREVPDAEQASVRV